MSVTDLRNTEPLLVCPSEDLDGGFVELFGAYLRLVFRFARPRLAAGCQHCRPVAAGAVAVAVQETS